MDQIHQSKNIEFLSAILVFQPWGMWDPSFPTRDWTCSSCVGRWSPNLWTTREGPETLCFLIGEFDPFILRAVIYTWGLTLPFYLLLSYCSLSLFIYFSLCFCLPFCFGGYYVFLNFLFFFFNVLCHCFRFMLCGYHEAYIKYLIDKILLFMLRLILSSLTYMDPIIFLFLCSGVVSNYSFLCCSFF